MSNQTCGSYSSAGAAPTGGESNRSFPGLQDRLGAGQVVEHVLHAALEVEADGDDEVRRPHQIEITGLGAVQVRVDPGAHRAARSTSSPPTWRTVSVRKFVVVTTRSRSPSLAEEAARGHTAQAVKDSTTSRQATTATVVRRVRRRRAARRADIAPALTNPP